MKLTQKPTLKGFSKRQRLPLLILGIIAAIFLLAYLGRGILRNDIAPGYFSMIYSADMNSALRSTNDEFHPFSIFSAQDVHTYLTSCSLDTATGVGVNVTCDNVMKGFLRVITIQQLNAYTQEMHTLNTALLTHGWQGGMQSLTSGKIIPLPNQLVPPMPISPITYTKTIHGNDCSLNYDSDDFAPTFDGGGITIQFWCEREGYFL